MNAPLIQKDDSHSVSSTNHIVQPSLWPELGVSTVEKCYFRLSGPVGYSLTNQELSFQVGGKVKTNTYYNLFNVGKWAEFCGNVPISLFLSGNGRFQINVFAIREHESVEKIFSDAVELDGEHFFDVNAEIFNHPRTILYFQLIALTEGKIEDFGWSTAAAPRQTPELTISITTFKREEAVTKTIDRFREFFQETEISKHLDLVVVDNGQTLDLEDEEKIQIIKNENLGGAGGFSRGLLEATSKGASHCLFMDDDASIQMGSITRTWWFLAYALDSRTAVSGAMIDGAFRNKIWENGALFNGGCRPLFHKTDLKDLEELLEMEFETGYQASPDFYGGWWFFAFPIAHAKHLPFPFFVRGDDVSFSLANDFKHITLPGVASIQESFSGKASPLTWYLDLRSHLAHHLSLDAKQDSWRTVRKMLFSFYFRTIVRFHYDSISAASLAIEDVLKGPGFFAENADMAQRRSDIKQLTKTEAWEKLDHKIVARYGKCPRPIRAILLLTLNGHLIPFSRFFGSELAVEAYKRENFREIYGARKITYLNSHKTEAYTVTRDHRRFWQETWRFIKNARALKRSYGKSQNDYRTLYGHLTSNEFWKEKLNY